MHRVIEVYRGQAQILLHGDSNNKLKMDFMDLTATTMTIITITITCNHNNSNNKTNGNK